MLMHLYVINYKHNDGLWLNVQDEVSELRVGHSQILAEVGEVRAEVRDVRSMVEKYGLHDMQ